MKSKSQKREEAEKRRGDYGMLTTQQKIESLDRKFGKNLGAVRQRAKLARLLALRSDKKQ